MGQPDRCAHREGMNLCPSGKGVIRGTVDDVGQVRGGKGWNEEIERARLNRLNINPRIHPARHDDHIAELGRSRGETEHVPPGAVGQDGVCKDQVGGALAAKDSPSFLTVPGARRLYCLALQSSPQTPQGLGLPMHQ